MLGLIDFNDKKFLILKKTKSGISERHSNNKFLTDEQLGNELAMKTKHANLQNSNKYQH